MSDERPPGGRPRYQIPLEKRQPETPEGKRRRERAVKKQRISFGKNYHDAQQMFRRKKWRYQRSAPSLSFLYDHGRKPDVVIADPSGRVRLGIWKNVTIGENRVRYSGQFSFLYWDYKRNALCCKWSINVRQMFLAAKLLHKAIEWVCDDAKIAYPAELFDHAQVGFEVQYGEGKRVIVESNDLIQKALEHANRDPETFDPKAYQMRDPLESYRVEPELPKRWEDEPITDPVVVGDSDVQPEEE